jgi:hypothetical protein
MFAQSDIFGQKTSKQNCPHEIRECPIARILSSMHEIRESRARSWAASANAPHPDGNRRVKARGVCRCGWRRAKRECQHGL